MNPLTGVGVQRGTVDPSTGLVTLTSWSEAGPDSTVTAFAASRLPASAVAEENNRFLSSEIVFRTPTAPLPGWVFCVGHVGRWHHFQRLPMRMERSTTPVWLGW